MLSTPMKLASTAIKSVVNPAATFSHPHANRHVHLKSLVVGYLFQRSRRRTIGLVVGREGLVVRAAQRASLTEVDAVLHEKADWIIRKLGEAQEREKRLAKARIVWGDGAVFPFFGIHVRVVLGSEKTVTGLVHTNDAPFALLHLGLALDARPEHIQATVQTWMMRQARAHFTQRLNHFAALLGVHWRTLGLSSARTRWGSARSDGSIRLNWRLMHHRPAVIDYVVAHELCHRRYMNHSACFWDTVRSVVPDYLALRAELRQDAMPHW
jgi:predicted metal-dependent hydrolase